MIRRTRLPRARRDEGSMTVELVALAPIIVVFAVLVLSLGRYELAQERVVGATFASAQAASLAASPLQAELAANQAVASNAAVADTCSQLAVTTDVTTFRAGGSVAVTLDCRVNLSDLQFPGIAGTASVQSRQVAPIDPYRAVQ